MRSKNEAWREAVRTTGIRLDRHSHSSAYWCIVDPFMPTRRVHLIEPDDCIGLFHSDGTCPGNCQDIKRHTQDISTSKPLTRTA